MRALQLLEATPDPALATTLRAQLQLYQAAPGPK